MTIAELEREVLNILGLCIQNGKIFDIDKGQYLLFNGKFIYMQDSTILIHKNDIKFNIINNVKLANYLLNVLIQKESEENGTYVKTISIGEAGNPLLGFVKRNIIVQLQFQCNDGIVTETLVGDYYFNLCISYISMIYKLSGTPLSFNLSDFDYTEQELIDMQSKRKNR